MARRKRCVVKRIREQEGKRRKREENEENIRYQIEKKKESVRTFFLCAVVIFGSIRNRLFRIKQTTSSFVFMKDIIDKQIR